MRTSLGSDRPAEVGLDLVTQATFLSDQHEVHGLGGLLMKRRGQVTVSVECQPDRAMAQQVLHELGMRTGLEQDAGRRMPQIVDAEVRQTGSLERSGEGVVDLTRFQRPTLLLTLLMVDESAARQLGDVNCAPALYGFGRNEHKAPARLPLQRSAAW